MWITKFQQITEEYLLIYGISTFEAAWSSWFARKEYIFSRKENPYVTQTEIKQLILIKATKRLPTKVCFFVRLWWRTVKHPDSVAPCKWHWYKPRTIVVGQSCSSGQVRESPWRQLWLRILIRLKTTTEMRYHFWGRARVHEPKLCFVLVWLITPVNGRGGPRLTEVFAFFSVQTSLPVDLWSRRNAKKLVQSVFWFWLWIIVQRGPAWKCDGKIVSYCRGKFLNYKLA